jgi:energy-coupling factor transport system ATP-binding protein
MIEISNLQFAYAGGPEILHGIDLRITDGEFLAIMGENGAGKTTLVKTFNGLLRPTAGRVVVDGRDTREESVASLARSVGLVFQNPDHQLFAETVNEEIAFSLRNFAFPEEVIRRRVEAIIGTLDLSRYQDSSPFILSGGERKRVALGAVMVWDPKHIILDEPTIGQDYQQKDRLRNFILQLNSQGKTVIIVTHDVEFVAECKPRVVLLSRGSIIADGGAEDILTNSSVVKEASLVMPQMAQLMRRLSNYGAPEKVIEVHQAREWLTRRIVGG